jgi:3-oxoacyl-[acyl-carrier protein] reductase
MIQFNPIKLKKMIRKIRNIIFAWAIFFVNISIAEAKVILITGASGDIGIAIAESLVKKDHQVICHYNSKNGELKALQKKYPQNMSLLAADFKKPETVEKLWKEAVAIAPVDVVINSAGVEIEDTSLQQIQDVININYLSPRLVCDHAVDHFHKQKIKGTIINLGSRAAYRGLPKGYYTYADTKAALNKYSQDIARDNAPAGISVYVVAPGPVRGKMFENLKPDVKEQCLNSMQTKKPVEISEILSLVDLLVSGQMPSATGGVFDLMGASVAH